ncbi:alpha/beta hydrolase [Pigmentiphaga aceris]|uniref:Alpha/beta hydrolase n=1 Tax=Pigmentiphaga aceris TaxID=1940612 RepID=A0A5C0B4T0_9BURK|nr:alpha/beta hydrolase [Pigmentiphaga aceris]QEI07881.1 alpha/beta hydrolase [Pigmentiphaga aceris]
MNQQADTTVPTLAPEVKEAQAQVKAAGIAASNVLTQPLAESRETNRIFQRFLNEPVPDVGRIVEHELTHLAHPVKVRLYYPASTASAALPAYLHVHGGGFAQGDINSLDRWKREIANDAGIVTVGLEYALSPEARYPVAIEQVIGALKWLRDQADVLGLDAERIAVGGDSAGGNLALNALLRLRDEADAFVKTGVIVYGMLSANHDSDSHRDLGDGRFGLSTEKLNWFWDQYTDSRQDPGVAPLYADVSNLPPLLLLAAALDPLLDDTLNLTKRLGSAGQKIVPRVYPGVPHGFIAMTRILPQARQARDDVVAHLKQHLA